MEGKIKNMLIVIGAVVIVAGLGLFLWWQNSQPGTYDDFAKCLKDKGAVFYGAFWCPHCRDQKDLFGSSQKYLPYVECSSSDGNSQLEICKKEKIESYPTWQFADGSREEGELSLEKLSEKSGCQLTNR